ncbi:MAG TPA: hypothetical protein VLX28_09465 [Thermoanaerobaculia bacterium]|nr:hypothetical protein [Thermoanaerobaculia bacterium]
MSRIPLARSIVLLLLVLLFVAAPFASAAAPPDRTVRSATGRFEAPALLSWLMSWLTGVWEKNGCMIDPDGRCLAGTGAAPAPPAGGQNNGCGIDPDGRCNPPALPAADNGCMIDPSGRCGS